MRQIGSQKTAITIGWVHSLIFGMIVTGLGGFTFFGILGFNTCLSRVNSWDWSAYILFWFSVLMVIAALYLISGARQVRVV